MSTLKLIATDKPKPEEAPAGLASVDVTIQADTIDELDGLEAKNLAFYERTKHGMADGGISSISGPMAIDAKTGVSIPLTSMASISKNRPEDIKYQRIFRITQSL
jgi:hypothetical protein